MYLGSVEFGQTFYFAVSNRSYDGSALPFTPQYYDVIDNCGGDVIISNRPLITATDRSIWYGYVNTRDTDTDVSGPFEPNRTYSIVIKGPTTDDPLSEDPTYFILYTFTVGCALSAKLQRLLGLCCENLLIDNFVYDNGNNATSFRVRVFDTSANASAATPDIESLSIPETGEISTYTITQTFTSGRNLRKTHLSTVNSDHGDL